MPFANANGVKLFYELDGAGDTPLVLVHGSWVSLRSWEGVASELRKSFRVLTYDRRGHSESERPSTQGSVHDDVDDLAALIEQLRLTPAWVAANSFGASIALRLAGKRPDLFRGLAVHEPPLFGLLAGDQATAPLLEEVGRRIGAVVERIRCGDHAGAAEQFVETVALGPGSWAQLAPEARQTFIRNAPTFLDEAADSEQIVFDPAWLRAFPRPLLLTMGDQSPPTFAPVIAKLAKAVPTAQVFTFAGAGHAPHASHPEAFVEVVSAFIRRNASAR